MKIAIFHNFMDNIGGAEMVSLIMGRELDADIYTTNIDHEKIKKMGFCTENVKSIGRISMSAPFRQQMALRKFRKLDLKKVYDFYIIAGDWAMSGAVNNKPNLWYVHSPIREIWDLYEYTRQNMVPWHLRNIFDLWAKYNRHLNMKYIQHAEKLLCNSRNTGNRIKKYLGREATVVYPPVQTDRFRYIENGDFWLAVNRLISHKRIDIQVKAFEKMPKEKLVIVGSYEQSNHFREYAKYINSIKPDNVEILSWVDSEKLLDIYSRCKGLIATAEDEDFGLTPVEAMASGKPVIAANEGGYRETVVNGKTGKLIDAIDSLKLISAVREVGKNPQNYKKACHEQARKFDTNVFVRKIKEEIGI